MEHWRLTVPPPLAIPTESSDWGRALISSTRDEALGQGTLTVSPLHMALVVATVANGGTMPDPRLAERIQDEEGHWRDAVAAGDASEPSADDLLSGAHAQQVLSAWRRCSADEGDGGVVGGLGGVAVAGEGAPHAWFLGVTPQDSPRYAAAVLVEHAREPARAVEVGCRLLGAALMDAD
jgi:peptidoglycan glycosyltransferase